MKSRFNEMLVAARQGGYAIGAFNILNHLTLAAVLDAAARNHSAVIIQTSVATLRALGTESLAHMARAMIDASPIPAVLHLDHCQDPGLCRQCCDLGWDSIMFDGSHLTLEENIKTTAEIHQYAYNKKVDVEGEVGIIAGTEDDISHDVAALAGFDETMHFIKKTSVEAIAPAIGTAHGIYKGVPIIHFDLVERLAKHTDCPIVVHGGTGLMNTTFQKLISLGASKINISTAIKHGYVGAFRQYLDENKNMVNPLKLDHFVYDKVVALIEPFFQLFGSVNRARDCMRSMS